MCSYVGVNCLYYVLKKHNFVLCVYEAPHLTVRRDRDEREISGVLCCPGRTDMKRRLQISCQLCLPPDFLLQVPVFFLITVKAMVFFLE